MARWRDRAARTIFGMVLVAGVAACGDTVKLPEAATSGALTAATVQVHVTGNAPAHVDPTSVSFQLDGSGALVVHLTVTSGTSRSQTVAVTASLEDSGGTAVGDATGGAVNVVPNAPTPIELTGQAPSGTIASVVFEVTSVASPTPTAH